MRGVAGVAVCLIAFVALGSSFSPGQAASVCSADAFGNVFCSGGAITSPITIYDPAAAFQPINGSNTYTPNNPSFPATGYNPAPPTVTVTVDNSASFIVTTNSTAALADKGLIVANYSNDENPAVNNVVVNNAGLISLTTSQIATSRMHDIVSDSQVNNFTVNNIGTIAVTQKFFGSTFDPAKLGVSAGGTPSTYTATYGGATLNVMSSFYSDDNTNEFTINNIGLVTAMGNYAAAYYGRADSTIVNSGTIANTTWMPGDSIGAGHWAIATWAGADFEALPNTNPDSPLNVVSNIAKNGSGALQGTIVVADTSATAITNNASGVITGDILAIDTTPQVYAAGIAGNATLPLAISGTNAGPRDSNIENYGLINGNIYLGSGTHVLDNAGGATINGGVYIDQRPSIATFSVADIYSTNPALSGTPLNGEPSANQMYLSAGGTDFAGNACPALGQATTDAGCAQSTKVLATYVGGQSLTLTNEGALNGDIVINDQPSSANSITLTGTGFSGNVIALNGVGANSLTLISVGNLESVQNFSSLDLQTSQVTVANGVSLVPHATLATTIFGNGGTLASPSTNLGTISGALTLQGPTSVVPTIGNIVHNGDVFEVASTVSGSGITVDNSSALVNFTADTSTGALLLKSSVLNSASVPGISNAGAAALDSLLSYNGGNPALQGLGAAVESLGAVGDVRSAGEQLRPDVNGASIMVPLGVSSLFQSQIDTRLDAFYFGNTAAQQAMSDLDAIGYAGPPALTKAPPSAVPIAGEPAFWGNLIGAQFNQQAIGPVAGYSASSGGLIVGADRPLSNSIRAGGAFGYATSSVSDKQAMGDSIGLDTYQGMIYASLAQPSWYANASFGFALEDYTTIRRVVFPGFSDVAYGNHTGELYLGRIDAGYPIALPGIAVVPVASLDWGHLAQDAYTEASGAGAALAVGSARNDSVRSEAGLKAFLPIASGPSFTATVGAHVEWAHEFGDVAQAVTAGFVGAGANFYAIGPTPNRDMADVGAEIEVANLVGGGSLTLNYSALLGSSYVQQAAMLRARVPLEDDRSGGAVGRQSKQAWSFPVLDFADVAPSGIDAQPGHAQPKGQSSPWTQLALGPGALFDQAPAAGDAGTQLPEIHVIATTPVAPPPRPRRRSAPAASSAVAAPAESAAPATEAVVSQPGVVDQDKIPSNVQVVGSSAFDYTRSPDLLQSMAQALPGVALSDQTGNQFQLDINYRGFTSSPVIGTPQGLAVYQNGVRINEVFGDVVNWDFIPQNAISDLTLVPSNPVYGLNAIGGALSFNMKNGFTYHGAEGDVSGGSYGRIGTSVQAGGEVGNLSGYIAADAIDDAGWRDDSPSSVRRVYADLGARGDNNTEFHVTFTGADNTFGAAAATPVQMLSQNWSSIYTVPQTTHNQLAFLTASASWKPTDTWTYQAIAYYRNFQQAHVDGNGTNADNTPGCLTGSPSDPICFDNPNGTTSPLITTTGQQVANSGALGSPNVLGEIDRTWTTTNSFGGTLQAASSEKLFGHDNNFTAGLSIDRGLVQFATTSELGTVNANQFPVVYGSGLFIDQPSGPGVGDVAPVGLGAGTLYTGLYATDTLDVTRRLSLTAGGRFNFAQITLTDELGNDSELNGNDSYTHFNPMIGATYKIAPNLTLYGDYAVSNRAPTPLELECADPARPCLIDNALVGDPPLKQVVTYTYEAGLRGQLDVGAGHANWSLGVYHALNTDDIIDVLSPQSILIGHEFFQNAGDTLRQGIEANLTYKQDRWNVYANYTYVDATFLSNLLLPSTVNASGTQNVVPGDHLTGVPDFRFKLGAEYQITDPWKFGADLDVIGSQWLVGDESNQLPQVPAYWVVNLHSSYKISDNVEVFGLVRNLFNQHYYTYGTLTDVTAFSYLNLTDDRTFLPGMPFAAYVGVRGTLPSGGPAVTNDSRPLLTKTSPSRWAGAPSPVTDWTGLYLGLNAGYSFGGSDWNDSVTGGSTGSFGTSGFAFGGTAGADYQVGSLVFGVEGDWDWADASGFGTFTATPLCAGGCLTTDSWLATVRGRAGYAFDRFLAYGTAGAAFGDVRANFSNDPVSSATKSGWTAGAGVEVALDRHWSAKAEYLFVDLGNGQCTTDCAIANASGGPTIPNVAVKFDESIVRGGVNYRFNF